MKCTACGIEGESLYTIESETNSYSACELCLVGAMNKLKRFKNRSEEEEFLLRELQRLLGKKAYSA